MKSPLPQMKLAMRNALRNKRRTALTAMTIVVGTALTTVSIALLGGIFGGMINTWVQGNGQLRIANTEYLRREVAQPLYENLGDLETLKKKVLAVDGVMAVEAKIKTGVVLAVGEEIGEDFSMLIGAAPSFYEQRLGGKENLVSGRWPAPNKDEVVLGRKVAKDIAAKQGQKILVLGTTQYGSMSPMSAEVVGIVGGNSQLDNFVFCDLQTAQYLVDIPDGGIELVLYTDLDNRAYDQIDDLNTRVNAAIGDDKLISQAWNERDMWSSTLPTVDAIDKVISFILVFVMVLAIFNTMTMSVMERTSEIGVLRAMGQSRLAAVAVFMLEAVTIGIIGGIIGVGMGGAFGLYLSKHGISIDEKLVDQAGTDFAMSATMYADMTMSVLAVALVAAVTTAILGAFFPSLRAASVQPSEAMRARR